MGEERENLQVKTYALHPADVATIEVFAKEHGYPSASSALRRIIAEWKSFKGVPNGNGDSHAYAAVDCQE